ncbi:hypothetical protein [uncultured Hymenobacter sp.]|uniref:hypothetical protein n=1 Tax=uncultured Hymenobacter sp. TaxID=170016 RepID=UPI0035CAF2E5
MLELSSAGRPVALSPGTSLQLELNSPLFDEEVVRGSFAYSFSIPAFPNGPLYGFPERLDADQPPGAELPAELRLDGLPLLLGTQRVRSAGEKKYSVSLNGTLGGLAAALSRRAIPSFEYGGLRQMPPAQPYGGGEVGGLLQVPGWVLHANEVVRHPESYDYVFAPVRVDNFYEPAPAATDPPPAAVPPIVLNPWVANSNAANAYGLPAGGTFTPNGFIGYQRVRLTLPNIFGSGGLGTVQPTTPSGETIVLPVFGQLACPFPRLRYVLRCIFEESGQRLDEPRFLPGELGELVIVSPHNALSGRPDPAGVLQSSFRLADALPDVSVAQLLLALRRGLGVVVDTDPATGLVYTRYLHELVATPAAEADDWTGRLAGPAEVEIAGASALKLVYETDPDDALTKDLLQQAPDPATLGPAVDTLAELPRVGLVGLPPETRLVRQAGAYYRSRATYSAASTTELSWFFLAEQLDGVQVGGAGGPEQAQGFAFTQLGRAPFQLDPANAYQLDPRATEFMEVPAMRRPGFEPGNLDPTAPGRPTALRLLFWRGLQPASDGTSLYPLLTPLHTNQAGQTVGQLSLRLSGPAGTYVQLLRGWLEVQRRGVVVKQALRLSSLDLGRLDLSRKVRLDGVEYFVRKLSPTVPLRKPVGAELVRAS